ncbi:MAG: RdgB/HAM1 family non-canonical purine NTP pyrophosphatase [Ignavibacteriae bacterium]|nr:RdgB/HAM1 family non-canonical purine NTP pyrophosphatase [Ignavibacteriota bacterium]
MPHQLVLATHNKHKAEEFQALLVGSGIDVLTLDDFPSVGEIVEDSDSLEGNALKKAREVFRATQLPSLADDTGLEVDYLHSAPGVLSARYAGPNATYTDNVRKLLHALSGVPAGERGARFRSVLGFVTASGEHIVEGICPGVIIEHPKGTSGFGYDPIFLPTGYNETFAEMNMEVKNTLSHRARALQQIKDVLLNYFRSASGSLREP